MALHLESVHVLQHGSGDAAADAAQRKALTPQCVDHVGDGLVRHIIATLAHKT